MPMQTQVVISGCSGGGKSSLLGELQRRSYVTVIEPGRRIIAEQTRRGGNALPWSDMAAFLREALHVAEMDLKTIAWNAGPIFFDRVLIDAAAALQRLRVPGVVHQHLPHRTGRQCQKVIAVLRGQLRATQLQVRLVHEGGGFEDVAHAPQLQARGARIRMRLAGDLHHYHRESLATEAADTHLITCGAGGAFLHPTHGAVVGRATLLANTSDRLDMKSLAVVMSLSW